MVRLPVWSAEQFQSQGWPSAKGIGALGTAGSLVLREVEGPAL